MNPNETGLSPANGHDVLTSVAAFAGGRIDHLPDAAMPIVVERLNQILGRDGSEGNPLLTVADWRAFEQVQTEYGMGGLVRLAAVRGYGNHGLNIPPAPLPPLRPTTLPTAPAASRPPSMPGLHAGMMFSSPAPEATRSTTSTPLPSASPTSDQEAPRTIMGEVQ